MEIAGDTSTLNQTTSPNERIRSLLSSVIADKLGVFWIFVASSLFLWASLPILN